MNKGLKRKARNTRFALRRGLFNYYAKLKHYIRIWKLLNRPAITTYKNNKPELSPVQQGILDDLCEKGIAVTSLEELFPNENKLSELLAYVEKRNGRAMINRKKKFIEDLISPIPELGPEVPFFNMAVNPTIIDVVNSYLGMHSTMHHFVLRRYLPSSGKLPSHSQNWHRAPQEKMNCRVYIYLSDVDEDSGPFTYIPYSTFGKKWGSVAEQEATCAPYLTAETIESIVPKDEHLSVCGKAGTVIFCDSTGLHRGGYSEDKYRIMSTFGYGAPTLRENISYSYTDNLLEKIQNLPQQSKDVLHKKWKRNSL